MVFRSQCSMSRDNFDGMLAVVGSLLPEGHILPKNLYESQKLLRALKMPYEHIHACPNGCVLFRKDHEKTTHCPKCKSSRSTLVMARRNSLVSPQRSYSTFLSYQGSNGCT
jgi:hypothetical protein